MTRFNDENDADDGKKEREVVLKWFVLKKKQATLNKTATTNTEINRTRLRKFTESNVDGIERQSGFFFFFLDSWITRKREGWRKELHRLYPL